MSGFQVNTNSFYLLFLEIIFLISFFSPLQRLQCGHSREKQSQNLEENIAREVTKTKFTCASWSPQDQRSVFFATYVENSAPVASLSGEYEELLSQNEGKELVLFDLHLLKWDQFCISAVHYNTVYVIDNLQNGLTYKECFAQLFHFWPLKENKMIQAGRRKFQQFLSCFKCNWKKKKRFWKIKRVEYCCPVMIREFLCSREWKFLFVLPVVLIKNTLQTCL